MPPEGTSYQSRAYTKKTGVAQGWFRDRERSRLSCGYQEPSMRADRSSRARKIECHCGTASKLQEAEFEMTKNPWLSLGLSAANTWAGVTCP